MKTCYVVGAGGSVPYGYPVGGQLVAEIATMKGLHECFRMPPLSLSMLASVAEFVSRARPLSIDQYVRDQSNLGDGARVGVAISLLRREAAVPTNLQNPSDWLRLLFESHRANLLSSAPPELAFVTFNYDYEIELQLLEMLSGYPTKVPSPLDRFAEIPIVHVHGALGPRPNVRRNHVPGTSRMLRADLSSHIVDMALECAESLRFFWEHDDASRESEQARKLIREAQRLVVIGVGQAAGPLRSLVGNRDILTGTNQQVRVVTYRASLQARQALSGIFPSLELRDEMTQWDICECFQRWGIV